MRLGKTACYLFKLDERRPVFGVFRVPGLGQLGKQGLNFSAKLIRIDIHQICGVETRGFSRGETPLPSFRHVVGGRP